MPTELGDFHHPLKLGEGEEFKKKYQKALNYAEEGLPAKDACVLAFGISKWTYDSWWKMYKADVVDGFTDEDSNLIKLFNGLSRKDALLHLKLKKTAMDIAVNDKNVPMLQFLLKTGYGYSEKTKAEVDISIDDAPVKFEIVDMTPNEEEED